MTTPPGWYPDPGQTPQLPPQERWWDGTTWSAHTRPGTGIPPAPPSPPGGGAGRGPLIAGIVGAVVLVAALALAGVLLVGGSDDDADGGGPEAGSKPSPSSPEKPGDEGDGGPSGEESPAPGTGGVVGDPRAGVGMPVLDGWEQPHPDSAFVSSKTSYACPKPQSQECVRGGASVLPVSSGWDGEKALKEAAGLQVAKNAEESYAKKAYGGITSHKVTEKGAVTVMGQSGYRVRWRIDNEKGPDAYVESVVFRSPHLPEELLTLWSSVDVADDAPPPADLDALRTGLVKTELGGGDSGSGEAV
ncbi:DUF2510 domain-containing protein [Streptomyces axinellae]|uniref:DUF2510 domain-containing protein n=1 Tax=Streptomyces axinellae TaxID=552788 RepID=A0ABP6BZP1_9ACTN